MKSYAATIIACLLACATLVKAEKAPAQAAPGNPEANALLNELAGKDLRTIPEAKMQHLERVLKETTGLSVSGSPFGKPWFLWAWDKGAGFVLFLGHPLVFIPGSSSATIWVLDANGKLLSKNEFTTMYRGDILAARYQKEPFSSEKVIRIETRPMRSDISNFLFVALLDERPLLVRIENQKGEWGINQYYAPNFTVGPLPPKRSPDEWAKTLKTGTPAEILEALVWLGGRHLDPDDRKPDVHQEDEASVRVYRTTRAREDVRTRVRELSRSSNRWIAEAAGKVLGE